MKRVLGACLAVLAFFQVAAAASSLVGQWEAAEEGVKLIFRDSGTLSIVTKGGSQPGTWSAEGERLVMTLRPSVSSESVTLACRFVIAGDSLTISPGDAKCGESTFKRAP